MFKKKISKETINTNKLVKKDRFSSFSWQLLKWIYLLLLFSILLVLFVINRLSLAQFGASQNPENLAALTTLGAFPHFVFFLLNLCIWINKEAGRANPSMTHIKKFPILCLEFMEGAIQGAGKFIFLYFTITKLNKFEIIIATQCFAIGPILMILLLGSTTFCKKSKDTETESQISNERKLPKTFKTICIQFLHYIFQGILLAGQVFGWIIFLGYTKAWELIFAVALMSFGWWKNYVPFYQLPSRLQTSYRFYYDSAGTINEFAQLVSIFGASIASFSTYLQSSPATFGQYFISIWTNSDVTYIFYLNIFSGFLCFLFSWTSVLSTIQFCFGFAFFLSSPVALIWQWSCPGTIIDPFIFSNCNPPPFQSGLVIAFVLLWITSTVVVFHIFDLMHPLQSNMKRIMIWTSPGYSFLPEHLAFNRRRIRPTIDNFTEGYLDDEKDYTFVVATMYNESSTETKNLLGSLLDIDNKVPVNGKEGYEFHITVDNAIQNNSENPFNQFTNQLFEILKSYKMKEKKLEEKWYGKLVLYQFPSGRKLKLHLKDSAKVKRRKRWSQIIYTSEILKSVLKNPEVRKYFLNTFLLTLDGDTSFSKEGVDLLKKTLKTDPSRTGAVVGRIIPVCENNCAPNLWVRFQQFDYAAGHWLQKTAEDIFGTVLCASGCFSMIRLIALIATPYSLLMESGSSAIEQYAEDALTPKDVHRLDQGEDRMLTTLLIQNGWSIRYEPVAIAKTFCPENMHDFFVQRRRWISSTLINTIHIISHSVKLIKANRSISSLFMFYIATVFAFSLLTPSTVVVMILLGLNIAFKLTDFYAILVSLFFPFLYILICYFFSIDLIRHRLREEKQKRTRIQIQVAKGLMFIYGILFLMTLGGLLSRIVSQILTVEILFFLFMAFIFIFSGVLHGELGILIWGILYVLLLPTVYLLLPIFVIANMHDHSWGTRETAATDKSNANLDKNVSFEEKNLDLELKQWETIQHKLEHTVQNKLDKQLFSSLVKVGENLTKRANFESSECSPQREELMLKGLTSLRNRWALFLLFLNLIFASIVIVVSFLGVISIPNLPSGGNIVALLLLFCFSTLLIFQFIAMLIQRYQSLNEVIAQIHLSERCTHVLEEDEEDHPNIPQKIKFKPILYKILGRPIQKEGKAWKMTDISQYSPISSRVSNLSTPLQKRVPSQKKIEEELQIPKDELKESQTTNEKENMAEGGNKEVGGEKKEKKERNIVGEKEPNIDEKKSEISQIKK